MTSSTANPTAGTYVAGVITSGIASSIRPRDSAPPPEMVLQLPPLPPAGLSLESRRLSNEVIVHHAYEVFSAAPKVVRQGLDRVLPHIRKAQERYAPRFDIPLELLISLLYQESQFQADACSPYAWGVAQFTRQSAEWNLIKLKTYQQKDAPELWDAEQALAGWDVGIKKARKDMNAAHRSARTLVLRKDVSAKERSLFYHAYGTASQVYDAAMAGKDAFFAKEYMPFFRAAIAGWHGKGRIDERLDPERSCDRCVLLVGTTWEESNAYFKGDPVFNLLRAIAAYNAGFGAVIDSHGLPSNYQTVDYVRRITKYAANIQDPQTVWLTSPELREAEKKSPAEPVREDSARMPLALPDSLIRR